MLHAMRLFFPVVWNVLMQSYNGICINAELTNCGTQSCYELTLRVFAIQMVENGESHFSI